MSRPQLAALAGLFTAGLLAIPMPALAADYARGKSLYENRCGDCHSESVHGRDKRVARDFGEVRGWVERWNRTLRAGWGAEEVNDVAVYLNSTYYAYPCPPSVCKVVSLLEPRGQPVSW